MKPIRYLVLFVTLLLVAACSDHSMPTSDNSQDTTYLGSIELTLGDTGLQVQSNELLACARINVGNSTIDDNTVFSFSVPYTIDTSNCSETLANLGLIPLNVSNTVGNSPFVSGATAIPQAVAESVTYVGATDVSASESELNAALSGVDTPSLPGTIDIAGATIIPRAFVDGTVAFTASESFSGSMVVGVFSIAESDENLPGTGGDENLPGTGGDENLPGTGSGDESFSVVFADSVAAENDTTCESTTVCTRTGSQVNIAVELVANPNVPITLVTENSNLGTVSLSLSATGPSNPFTVPASLTPANPDGNINISSGNLAGIGTYVATITASTAGGTEATFTYTLIIE